jgi:hypothetical protein
MKFLQNISAAFLLTGMLFSTAQAQSVAADSIAFQAGENLTYAVSYKIGFIEPDIADVTFSTINSTINDVPAYRVSAVAEVDSKWRWFFDMRDEYNAWLDCKTLRPLYFSNNIKEGNYRFVSSYLYDWDKRVVISDYKNLRINEPHQKIMPLTDESFDGVSLFFNMRNQISSEMTPGQKAYIQLVLSDTIKQLQYRFIGPEVRKIKGLGKYRTLKFACQLTNDTDQESFPEGNEFFIWFSDDRNRIPLYLESPIRVGSIKGYLTSYQGLKYPLGGKVQ